MPTIFQTTAGWAVRIYPNDHRPPHVHVVGPTAEARYALLCDLNTVRLIDNFGFSLADVNDIARQLVARLPLLCRKWSEIHG